jgi:sensor histidine kinase regulating citrate/malate metabolism
MNLKLLRPHSLKTKVTFFTLAIFVVSIWSLSLYVSHMLYEDMERQLGEQQLSAASYMASEINTQMDDRVKALEMIARVITPAMINNPATLQQFIDQRFVLHHQFNGGVFALSHEGW